MEGQGSFDLLCFLTNVGVKGQLSGLDACPLSVDCLTPACSQLTPHLSCIFYWLRGDRCVHSGCDTGIVGLGLQSGGHREKLTHTATLSRSGGLRRTAWRRWY